ncbi:hypothetical protein [Bradyrhizobium commune]|uniref:Uncharacterized protein n=1 Tax=Bradyrhizobium commune TaxID=83627 RepID=A0A7S9GY59_9BRAD|nr:hypothetical protein [Bradyrhizobium commune]QPF90239.1 hypothetical protein IC761_27610 [Bradyrhizobium commune]
MLTLPAADIPDRQDRDKRRLRLTSPINLKGGTRHQSSSMTMAANTRGDIPHFDRNASHPEVRRFDVTDVFESVFVNEVAYPSRLLNDDVHGLLGRIT